MLSAVKIGIASNSATSAQSTNFKICAGPLTSSARHDRSRTMSTFQTIAAARSTIKHHAQDDAPKSTLYPQCEKKTARSCDIGAIAHKADDVRARLTTQRAPVGNQWGDEAKATCHAYRITTKLRMLRVLSLQSAFLAKGGTL